MAKGTCRNRTGRPGQLLGLAILALSLDSAWPALAAEDDPPGQASYHKLHPDLIVNLSGPEQGLLLVTVEVMSREPAILERVARHTPALRHALLLLLGDQEASAVKRVAGRERVRAEALATVNDVLEQESRGTAVEALYFTNFILE
jgi:flagellar FliL protein